MCANFHWTESLWPLCQTAQISELPHLCFLFFWKFLLQGLWSSNSSPSVAQFDWATSSRFKTFWIWNLWRALYSWEPSKNLISLSSFPHINCSGQLCVSELCRYSCCKLTAHGFLLICIVKCDIYSQECVFPNLVQSAEFITGELQWV